jgi:hypothetical protein
MSAPFNPQGTAYKTGRDKPWGAKGAKPAQEWDADVVRPCKVVPSSTEAGWYYIYSATNELVTSYNNKEYIEDLCARLNK